MRKENIEPTSSNRIQYIKLIDRAIILGNFCGNIYNWSNKPIIYLWYINDWTLLWCVHSEINVKGRVICFVNRARCRRCLGSSRSLYDLLTVLLCVHIVYLTCSSAYCIQPAASQLLITGNRIEVPLLDQRSFTSTYYWFLL